MKTKHKQVKIQWGDREAEVDEGIAPLILEIWKAGIDTCMSCQENRPGIIWLNFWTIKEGEKFLTLIAKHPPKSKMRMVNGRMHVGNIPFWETLYARITDWNSDNSWEYDVHPMDDGIEEEVNKDEVIIKNIGPSKIRMNFSVRFPVSDLEAVMKRLRHKNAKKARR